MGNDDTASDPMQELANAMATTVGSQELALRMKLGNDDYDAWKRRSDSMEEAAVRGATWDSSLKMHNAEIQRQQAQFISAKAAFWRTVTAGALLAIGCGVAEFIRWVAGS